MQLLVNKNADDRVSNSRKRPLYQLRHIHFFCWANLINFNVDDIDLFITMVAAKISLSLSLQIAFHLFTFFLLLLSSNKSRSFFLSLSLSLSLSLCLKLDRRSLEVIFCQNCEITKNWHLFCSNLPKAISGNWNLYHFTNWNKI